ncbi:hypothetical protein F5Y19DRAFT_128786 [Xylariaceae sp. FL1651]|nr:hypothetical protein F5Y19DRAFT_128786 [Xylariaceae sp. FL1651]
MLLSSAFVIILFLFLEDPGMTIRVCGALLPTSVTFRGNQSFYLVSPQQSAPTVVVGNMRGFPYLVSFFKRLTE